MIYGFGSPGLAAFFLRQMLWYIVGGLALAVVIIVLLSTYIDIGEKPMPPSKRRQQQSTQPRGPIADDPAVPEDLGLGAMDDQSLAAFGAPDDGAGSAMFLSVLPMPLPQATLDSLSKQGATYLGATAFDDAGTMWLLSSLPGRPLAWVGIDADFVPYEEISQPPQPQQKPGELPPGPLQEYRGP